MELPDMRQLKVQLGKDLKVVMKSSQITHERRKPKKTRRRSVRRKRKRTRKQGQGMWTVPPRWMLLSLRTTANGTAKNYFLGRSTSRTWSWTLKAMPLRTWKLFRATYARQLMTPWLMTAWLTRWGSPMASRLKRSKRCFTASLRRRIKKTSRWRRGRNTKSDWQNRLMKMNRKQRWRRRRQPREKRNWSRRNSETMRPERSQRTRAAKEPDKR